MLRRDFAESTLVSFDDPPVTDDAVDGYDYESDSDLGYMTEGSDHGTLAEDPYIILLVRLSLASRFSSVHFYVQHEALEGKRTEQERYEKGLFYLFSISSLSTLSERAS